MCEYDDAISPFVIELELRANNRPLDTNLRSVKLIIVLSSE